jgi:hypothetical protein
MGKIERTAAYYILTTGVFGVMTLLLLAFRSSPNHFLFGFVDVGRHILGYCYWRFWR